MSDQERGIYISMLGIDGVGKTTLAEHLTQRLRDQGRQVTPVSWRTALDAADLPVWPQEALRTLWIDTFRLVFGGARHGGSFVSLPERYADWVTDRAEESLGDLDTPVAAPAGPLAAMLVEFAGNLVLYSEVIRPALDRGEIVIQETFPYKHILKEYLLAAELTDDSDRVAYRRSEISSLFAPLEAFFGGPMRPDVGLLVDGPAELAYRWRMRQSGRIGVLEDMRAAGGSGPEGFIQMQNESARHYRAFAERWGWSVHQVTDTPLQENLARGLALLMTRIDALRPDWGIQR